MAKHTGKKKGSGGRGVGPAGAPAAVEHWKDQPDGHDYPAAHDYLSLIVTETFATALVDELRGAPIVHRKAKDLLRASRLALLEASNPHVAADLDTVAKGGKLSPVLCVRGALTTDVGLTVADGYHRICASYHLDENADIPCHLVDLPSLPARSSPPGRSSPSASRRRAHATGPDTATT